MADDGSEATFYLHYDDARVLLLTEEEQAGWTAGGQYDKCALTRTTEQ